MTTLKDFKTWDVVRYEAAVWLVLPEGFLVLAGRNLPSGRIKYNPAKKVTFSEDDQWEYLYNIEGNLSALGEKLKAIDKP